MALVCCWVFGNCFAIGGSGFSWLFVGVMLTYLLPGMLSATLELMRILEVLPLCLFLVALGILLVGEGIAERSSGHLGLCGLSLSVGLDLYQLWGPYHRHCVPDAQTVHFKNDSKSP